MNFTQRTDLSAKKETKSDEKEKEPKVSAIAVGRVRGRKDIVSTWCRLELKVNCSGMQVGLVGDST